MKLKHLSSCLLGCLMFAASCCAQSAVQKMTLAEALRIAQGKSEQTAIARAGGRRAEAEQIRARAQRLPQVSGFASYSRTLASQFSGLFDREQGQPCAPLAVNAAAPALDRIAELERFLACGGASGTGFGGGDDNGLPFGRTNIWLLGLSFTQPVYAGGRIAAQNRIADAGRRAADIQIASADAQFVLDVTQAFYDTALAEALLQIAEANLQEASRNLEFVRLARKVGRLPEFDVLRAEVGRRNLLPEIARRRSALAQSSLRLRQLLEMPPDAPLHLESGLLSASLAVPPPFEERFRSAEPLLNLEERAPLRQAEATLRQREAGLDFARRERLPTVNIVSDYSLYAYPRNFFPTSTNQFRNDWSLGLSLQVPIFLGGRLRADVVAAEAGVEEARAQRDLTRELARLDAGVAADQLQTAQEEWQAAGGTVDEASRALEIANIRFREGISNQLELNDARLALLEARGNRAQAARNLQVARVTIALLPLLPLNTAPQTPGQPSIPLRGQPGAGLPAQLQTGNPFGVSPASSSPGGGAANAGGNAAPGQGAAQVPGTGGARRTQ